ncbi:hypothetical protein JX265_009434 [Neoarthrinium moseri]|uniref:Zn(2)-C6 fungal-type domain-containing protein n=1 Tax=Neoarthrinium moseri TaxID=1658444 RepID=A0A9P9WGJ4_9PEZI|nr:hypothetical protein JX266_012002 [Neoarthrinium moseri]KAI1861931.1 hypothetical protein JX265_009434 [Neoarthrinium moseri]
MWKRPKHPGACHECRKRRLKCDEAKPRCLKCEKNRRVCPGYTNWSELAVRDMTASTISRFHGAKSNASNGSTRSREVAERHSLNFGQTGDRPDASSPTSNAKTSTILRNPIVPLEDQALCYLRLHFLDSFSQGLDPGYSHVLRLVLQLDEMGDCLSTCVSAAALGVFSTRPNAKVVEVAAHKMYTIALSRINFAIRDRHAVEDDRILASVLMLAFYEIFRSNKLTGFYNHIFGAASMIKSRGERVVHDKLTAELYLLVRYELCRTSILGFATPSNADLGMWLKWRNTVSYATFSPTYLSAVGQYSGGELDHLVRSRMDFIITGNPITETINRDGFPKEPIAAQGLVKIAVDYIKYVIDGFTDMETEGFVTQESRPLRLPCPIQRDSTYPGAYPNTPIYVYKTVHHASFHLAICLARVSCFTHLMALTSQLGCSARVEQMPAYKVLTRRVQDDIETIVSSVPFVCGWTADGVQAFSGSSESSEATLPALETSFATSFVIWALIGPATCPLATDNQRTYLMHMLRYIANVRRVRQAEALLDVTAQTTTRLTLSRWHHTVLTPGNVNIPASWIGQGTSLEAEIYRSSQDLPSSGTKN